MIKSMEILIGFVLYVKWINKNSISYVLQQCSHFVILVRSIVHFSFLVKIQYIFLLTNFTFSYFILSSSLQLFISYFILSSLHSLDTIFLNPVVERNVCTTMERNKNIISLVEQTKTNGVYKNTTHSSLTFSINLYYIS